MEGAPLAMDELRALSRGLRVPMRAFATGDLASAGKGSLGLLFRTPTASPSIGDQTATVEQVAGFVEAALEVLPSRCKTPNWLSNAKKQLNSALDAEHLAEEFRKIIVPEDKYQEPLLNLPSLASNIAGIIFGTMRKSRYEGASIIAGYHPFIFVSPRFPPRSLFTFAHEIGHLAAHHCDGGEIWFDLPTQIGGWKAKNSAERFADSFASALLMPAAGVGVALDTIRRVLSIRRDAPLSDVQLLYLSRIFGVSFEVAGLRCERLGLLEVGATFALAQHIRIKHKSPEKRAEEINLPPRPQPQLPSISANLMRAILEGIRSGKISIGYASERFGISIDQIFLANAGQS